MSNPLEEEEGAVPVTTTERPWWGVGRLQCPAAKARKCVRKWTWWQHQAPLQTMRDVDFKVSASGSNKQVRGGCERPASQT